MTRFSSEKTEHKVDALARIGASTAIASLLLAVLRIIATVTMEGGYELFFGPVGILWWVGFGILTGVSIASYTASFALLVTENINTKDPAS